MDTKTEIIEQKKKRKRANRIRMITKRFCVTEQENNIIKSRIESCHAPTESDYLRKVAIDTCYYYLDLEPIDNLRKEVNYIGKNINQVTKMCHEQGNITESQIRYLTDKMQDLDDKVADALNKFMKMDKAIKRE